MSEPLRVLQIEDVEDDALLVALELRRGGWDPACTRVDTAAEMRSALRNAPWDLVISDFGLPAFDAPSALSVVQELALDVPFIIVSGTITEEAAVAAMKAGAHDYVTKSNLKRLVPAVQRELREARSRQERRRQEALRRHAEARFHTLVQSMDGLVFTLDDQGILDGVFGRGLGGGRVDEARYLGRPVHELFGREPGAPDGVACRRALAGEHVVLDWTHETPSGVKYLQAWLGPIALDDGRFQGLVGVARDVTQEKQLQATVLQTERLASVGALAASIGHEIKNPLAAFMATMEAAAEDLRAAGAEPGGAHAAIAKVLGDFAEMRVATERVRQVTHDLHVVSRAREDQREPVDVRALLDASVRLAWHEIRHRARLIRDLDEPVPPVMASEARLGQVFLNLLVNAAQAISPGRAQENEIRVRVRARGPQRVAVEISDTGEGIPESVRQRLFTPFFTTKPEGAGTGLGLSICQRIVTDLGGTIEVESTPGKGSTFRVVLVATSARPSGTIKLPPPVATPAARPARVLVIDDEAILRRALKRALGGAHEVVLSESGHEALERIGAGERFDVIFCDMMMPEMTGVEFYAALHQAAPEQAARLIFLTGGVVGEGLREFLERIPNATVEKPFEARHLLDLVAQRVA